MRRKEGNVYDTVVICQPRMIKVLCRLQNGCEDTARVQTTVNLVTLMNMVKIVMATQPPLVLGLPFA